jgi:AcrR family transcriptional regulator
MARHQLSREEVVSAAVAFVHESGARSLTMRALGGRLGVTAGAIYRHVPEKRSLLALVADAIAAQLLPVAEEAFADLSDVDAWFGASRRLAVAGRAHWAEYPGVTQCLLAHGPTPTGQRIVDVQVASLVSLGVDPATAARTYEVGARWVIAYITAEQIPSERAPQFSQEATFTEGLDALLAGLRTRLA